MNINKLKEILQKYPSELIIKVQIDDEIMHKLEYSKMIQGGGLQIIGNDSPYECKPVAVSELLNNLKEFKADDNIFLFEDVTDWYDEYVTIKIMV